MSVTTDATKQKAVDRSTRSWAASTRSRRCRPPGRSLGGRGAARPPPQWWELRIERQKEIDASIAAKADFEYLYDKPYEDTKIVRVAGPFTVESLISAPRPRRRRGRRADRPARSAARTPTTTATCRDFDADVLENLRTAGVQQAHKEDRIDFTSLTRLARRLHLRRGPLPGGRRPRSARGIFIGPEFGTVHAPRPRRRRARGRRRRLRRAHRLRLQLRGPRQRVRQAGPHPRPQGAHERRPAHGRRPEEHRQGQPLRHLRRARHRHPR